MVRRPSRFLLARVAIGEAGGDRPGAGVPRLLLIGRQTWRVSWKFDESGSVQAISVTIIGHGSVGSRRPDKVGITEFPCFSPSVSSEDVGFLASTLRISGKKRQIVAAPTAWQSKPPSGLVLATLWWLGPRRTGQNQDWTCIQTLFEDDHVHMALIVAADGRLLTTIERSDITTASSSYNTVAELGTLVNRTVGPSDALDSATVALQRNGRRRLAVVDDSGRLLGLLCLKRETEPVTARMKASVGGHTAMWPRKSGLPRPSRSVPVRSRVSSSTARQPTTDRVTDGPLTFRIAAARSRRRASSLPYGSLTTVGTRTGFRASS